MDRNSLLFRRLLAPCPLRCPRRKGRSNPASASGSFRTAIILSKMEAVLTKNRGSTTWQFTEKLVPDSEARGVTRSTDTQSLPIPSRQALGAGSKIMA